MRPISFPNVTVNGIEWLISGTNLKFNLFSKVVESTEFSADFDSSVFFQYLLGVFQRIWDCRVIHTEHRATVSLFTLKEVVLCLGDASKAKLLI